MNDLDERILDDYLAGIDRKLDAAAGADWSSLSDAERATITGYLFALEITNGGIEQFLVNPSGDRWRETLQAIRTVGASRLGDLFEQALAIFPDNAPSVDQVTRCSQLAAAGETARELLWRLTGQYYDLQAASSEHCLYQKLTAFAKAQMATENPK